MVPGAPGAPVVSLWAALLPPTFQLFVDAFVTSPVEVKYEVTIVVGPVARAVRWSVREKSKPETRPAKPRQAPLRMSDFLLVTR